MRLLLDTHVLLWALADPRRLPESARDAIEAGDNEILFSAASIWEIAIKSAAAARRVRRRCGDDHRCGARDAFQRACDQREHAAAIATLPPHHKDPFDRLLIGQALTEPARLITADKALAAYSNDLVWLIAYGRVAPHFSMRTTTLRAARSCQPRLRRSKRHQK